MDLLLDINVAVDSITGREPWYDHTDLALAKSLSEGGRIWLYAGSVQTLEYVTRAEIKRRALASNRKLSAKQIETRARQLLSAFEADKHWLAALAGEGSVYDCDDPEDEQLIRAIERFPEGAIRLLTRDDRLLTRYPEKRSRQKTIVDKR